jgi:hypothetical protein
MKKPYLNEYQRRILKYKSLTGSIIKLVLAKSKLFRSLEESLSKYFEISLLVAALIPFFGLIFSILTNDLKKLENPMFNAYHIFLTIIITLITLFNYYT